MKVASVATLGVTMWRSGQDVPGRLPRAGLEVALCIVGDLNEVFRYSWRVSQSSFIFLDFHSLQNNNKNWEKGKGSVLTLF